MSATLRLRHHTIGVEVRRYPYQVFVDGDPAGSVEMNKSIEIPLAAGEHTLQVRDGRKSSRIKTFILADGDVARFRCGGKSILPVFLLSFFIPSLALTLTRE